jgi:diaminopimelate epimerase
MKFTKMQGAGNDFVVIQPKDTDRDWSKVAVRACDRRFGIGADGIILALPSNKADLRMRIFNADGSEAETCGNGLRCLAKFAVLNNLVAAGTREIRIETIPGISLVRLEYKETDLDRIQVGMGTPKFKPVEIPVAIEGNQIPILDYPLLIDGNQLKLSFVSMGNPHAIFFNNNSVSDYPLREIGPKVENNPLFPKRINFEIARIINRRKIEMRVWERGAGETLACGTGACAVAVAARLHGYVDNQVDITLPGGVLNIQWDGKGEVQMSGPAEVVFTGDWPE